MAASVGQITIMKWTHLDGAGGNAPPQAYLHGPPSLSCAPAGAVLEELAERAPHDSVAIAVVRARQGLLGLLRSKASNQTVSDNKTHERSIRKSREPP